jgi:DUF3011 family protein
MSTSARARERGRNGIDVPVSASAFGISIDGRNAVPWSGASTGGGSAQLPNGALQTVTCESIPGHTKRCTAMTANGVQLARQISKHSCVLNKDWGWDNNGIWVKDGCRAEFTVNTNLAPMASSLTTITCESANGMNHHCSANTLNGVTLSRQLSDSGCVEGKTWGYDKDGIWVSNGCRAEFTVGR